MILKEIICPICHTELLNLSYDDDYEEYWCECGYELRLDKDGNDITEEV